MKQIKDYLNNQKDVYTAAWINELQKEEVNLLNVKHYLEFITVIDRMIQNLK